jgi:alanine dehydrogenase
MALASKGFARAVKESQALATGVNTFGGYCTHQGVAESLNLEYRPVDQLIG